MFYLDKKRKHRYNKHMEINFEVLNYLNMINEKFGILYSHYGYNPLPDDFTLSEELIKERLVFNEMAKTLKTPNFIFEEKRKIRKKYKKSLKNTKKLEKIVKNKEKIDNFDKNNFLIYLSMRKKLLKNEILSFHKTEFEEGKSYAEIYNINPVFGKMFERSFEEDLNLENFLEHLGENYKTTYKELQEKVKKKKKEKLTESITTINRIVENSNIRKRQKVENVRPKSKVSTSKKEREV